MKEYKPKPKGAKIIGEQIKNNVTNPKEISNITGYSLLTVRSYLSRYYPSHRIRSFKYKEFFISKTTKNIIEKLNEGKKQADVARQFCVSRQRVNTIYNKYIKGEKMKKEFKIGDYVFAEDWCYGKIVYIDNKYAEVDFDTMHGGGSLTFALEDLRHAETPKRKLNYGRKNNEN